MPLRKRPAILLVLATLTSTALSVQAVAEAHEHPEPRAHQTAALCAPRRPWTPQDSATIAQQINRTARHVNNGLDDVKRLSAPTHPVYPASTTAATTFAAAEDITPAQAQSVLSEYMHNLCDA